jgi:hypothetical protein
MLTYLHTAGDIIDKNTLKQAAWYGRLECLKYAYKNYTGLFDGELYSEDADCIALIKLKKKEVRRMMK